MVTNQLNRRDRMIVYAKNNRTFLQTASALNIAFLISALGDRLWMFAIGLFLHQLGGITWIAIHQLVDSLAKLILTPVLGSLLDKTNRNKAQNAAMTVIDQTSSLLTPLIAGVMLDSMTRAWCCIVIIVWNIVSWSIEAFLLLWIYRRIPALAHRTRNG
ncbi:hypothetical protein NECAME_02819 [Necator americanus]|uniref:Solute carrier family 40 member n=1 Tax=Necator americanus TaxID=51031 RepID=W2TCD2_NECAM|nr:hypothetical protein NECAME_02819 [Necator americanus]ETN78672.1 hypothetical protein NECAME_02819 [Necator americanus]